MKSGASHHRMKTALRSLNRIPVYASSSSPANRLSCPSLVLENSPYRRRHCARAHSPRSPSEPCLAV